MKAVLSALTPSVPGRGLLTIKNWESGLSGLQIAIQRSPDENYLHGNETWSNSPHWFNVEQFNERDEDLDIPLNKDWIDPILGVCNAGALLLSMRDASGSTESAPVLVKSADLMSSLAGAQTGGYTSAETMAALNQQEEVAEVVEPEIAQEVAEELIVPEQESTVVRQQEKKSSNLLPIVIALVVLLLVAAIAAWFLLFNKPKVEELAPERPSVAVESVVEQQAENQPLSADNTESNSVVQPCSLEAMNSMAELEFVRACLGSSPGSEDIAGVISSAKESGKCGVAQRIYAHKGQAGDVAIALMYAKEYDPEFHQASQCFSAPDAATAAYWYETVLGHDPSNELAKQRFEVLKP